MWHLRVGFFAPSLLKYLNLVNSIRLKVCKTLNIPKVLLKYHVFCTEVLHFNVNLQEYSRYLYNFRSSRLEVFLGKDILKLCSKLTAEHPCRSVILIKLFCSYMQYNSRYLITNAAISLISVNFLFLLITLVAPYVISTRRLMGFECFLYNNKNLFLAVNSK